MKKFQKEVISKTLDAEKKILSDLQKQYSNAENDINRKIEKLLSRRDASSVYVQNQVKFLTSKKGEVTQILNNLKTKQYDSVQNYLKGSYEDGFMGTMYSLQKQGIPLVFPIDQKDVLKALTVNSKLSSKLYNALGVSVSKLKNEIRNELAIGLAQGSSYQEIAKKISMSSGSGLNNAYRIARTEGARVNQESKMDAMMKSKKAGADIVKTWDSTLDGRTRPHHQELNGQTREIDEPFEVAGRQAMNPCGFGVASEDINCRCTVLEEARWENKDKTFKTKYDGLKEGKGKIVNLKDCTTFEQFRQRAKQSLKVPPTSATTVPDAFVRNYSNEIGKTFGKDFYDVMHSNVENCEMKAASQVWKNYEDSLQITSKKNSGWYSPWEDRIYVDSDEIIKGRINSDGTVWTTPSQILFHEGGHAIDHKVAKKLGCSRGQHFSEVFENGKFYKTMKTEFNERIKSIETGLKEELSKHIDDIDWQKKNGWYDYWSGTKSAREKAYSTLEKEIYDLGWAKKGNISDMMQGISGCKIHAGCGHSDSYFKQSGGQAKWSSVESFAEMFDATMSNAENLSAIKKYFPESYKVFGDMMEFIRKMT
jgi:SPP1 gp7 family putative phage head morphogenesis protein